MALEEFSKLRGKFNAFIYHVYTFKAIYSVDLHLGQYFQSLPVTTLPLVPGSAEINISDLAKSLARTERPLRQHVEAHKKQNTLDSQRSATSLVFHFVVRCALLVSM